MEKNLVIIFYIISLILLSKCDEKIEQASEDDSSSFDDYDPNKYFKESLKEYLIEHKLFDSDKVIKPDEMKIIFLGVITEGEPDDSPDYMGGLYGNLADYFVEKYYKDKKEIKGKDLYDLFDMNEISKKFEELMADNPLFNGSEEENDFDSMDQVGDPSSDI